MEDKYIVALEIGSSKIKGAVGTVDPAGTLTVKAVEEEKVSDIVRYGCIRNVAETASAIRNVISRLEQREAPRRIEAVYLAAGGRSLKADPVQIERRLSAETEITRALIEDMTEEALSSPMHDRHVVGATIRDLRIDGTPTPRPIGQLGSHVLASMNILSCRNQLLRNLSHVIEERLRLKTRDTVIRPLAEADLVLVPNEMRLGCVFVDFGAETTTVSVYKDGALRHLAVLPLGSRNITRDITTLNHLEERAEELKIQGGSAIPSAERSSAYPAGSANFSAINNFVAARSNEIIANIVEQIKQSGLTADKLPGGIVIVGRGARLNGFNQRLSEAAGMQVRVGAPGQRIHITDGSIDPSDAVDIIAILAKAALKPEECMPMPEPEIPEPMQHSAGLYGADSIYADHTNRMPGTEPAPEQRPAQSPTPAQQQAPAAAATPSTPKAPRFDTVGDEEPAEQPKKGGFMKNLFKSMQDRVYNLVSDTLYEEEDD
ncbi:MAG: hypothetical protein K2K55_09725 [Duncaniella sp.]|nr:hypothetical protein [Duncaniella sp.]